MTFHIREAEEADTEGICILNQNELGYSYPPEKTKEKLTALLKSKKDKIFVAEAEGRIAGYIHACDYDTLYMPHLKNIMGIAVSGEYRRQGIGRTAWFPGNPGQRPMNSTAGAAISPTRARRISTSCSSDKEKGPWTRPLAQKRRICNTGTGPEHICCR